MVYPLTYRRPAYVSPSTSDQASMTSSESEKGTSSDGSLRSGRSGLSAGIPDALAFDKIIGGGTCPPCTLRDLMNYLIYIEHSAENLQFFLWYRDYVQRFQHATTSDIALSPEWTQAQHDAALQAVHNQTVKQKKGANTAIFKGTDFDNRTKSHKTEKDSPDPFLTPPRTPGGRPSGQQYHAWKGEPSSTELNSTYTSSNTESYRQVASSAFEAAGLKQPFTIQPFREEIDRVIGTYLAKDSPRELNISSRERAVVLRALEYTTHPSAFRAVQKTVESTLRRQSHPNFIRWTICNGNRPRVIFARGLGVSVILLSCLAAILITLSRAGRGWRALPAIGWVIGTATLIAAWKGMCVVLHGMHHRHLRPWELFEDPELNVELKKASFDSFSSSNSYEEQPWVVKYQKRNVIRKVFDREVWIQEPALRQIQDTIFLQSMLCAFLVAGVFCAIFVPLPRGGFY